MADLKTTKKEEAEETEGEITNNQCPMPYPPCPIYLSLSRHHPKNRGVVFFGSYKSVLYGY